MAKDTDRYNINAVERCFQIMDLLASKLEAISIQDVCEALGVNSNMAFRLLRTMEDTGYLSRDAKTGLYSLSLKVLKLSRMALQSLEIRKFAMPYLEMLWPKANINLGMRNGDEIIMVDRIDGNRLPRTYFTPGKVIPFHCTGLGKVLCSELSEEEVLGMIERAGGLKAYTADTITDSGRLLEELRRVREEEAGRDRNEYILNDNCSAVPIRDGEGRIVAAISASALSPNMTEEEIEGTIPQLRETANRISALLGYQAV